MIGVEDGVGDMLTELEDDKVETLIVVMGEVSDEVGSMDTVLVVDTVIDSDIDNDDKEAVDGVGGVVEVDESKECGCPSSRHIH